MFDIKLVDGRYFSNVYLWDNYYEEHFSTSGITLILQLSHEHKLSIGRELNEEEYEYEKDDIVATDIEYICESYKYKNGSIS